ncbi:MAG: LiaI-LiaF-like domain-containing protein, partial [Anaerolineales bacterium]
MRKHNLFWGVLFILVGALFMLNNLGVFNINVWKLLWPSFLIALGVWTIWATQPGQAAREVEQVVIPLDGAGQARVRIRYGAGRLRVGGGTGADELATGGFAGGLDYKTARAGETLEVDMRSPSADSPVVFIPWAWGPRDWNFSLNDQIPLSLDIKSGGSDIQLNLTGLRVTDLKLDTGASTTDIYLPANAGHTQVKVSGGATT